MLVPPPPPPIHLALNLTWSFPKSVSQTAATTLILSRSLVFLVNVNLTKIFKRSPALIASPELCLETTAILHLKMS